MEEKKIKKQGMDNAKSNDFDPMNTSKALLDKEGGEGIPLLYRPIRINKIDDARRLLSRLILEFQKGTIQSRDAKDLCYLVVSYVNVASQTDLEARLSAIEQKMEDK